VDDPIRRWWQKVFDRRRHFMGQVDDGGIAQGWEAGGLAKSGQQAAVLEIVAGIDGGIVRAGVRGVVKPMAASAVEVQVNELVKRVFRRKPPPFGQAGDDHHLVDSRLTGGQFAVTPTTNPEDVVLRVLGAEVAGDGFAGDEVAKVAGKGDGDEFLSGAEPAPEGAEAPPVPRQAEAQSGGFHRPGEQRPQPVEQFHGPDCRDGGGRTQADYPRNRA